jgi:hypothetical protein
LAGSASFGFAEMGATSARTHAAWRARDERFAAPGKSFVQSFARENTVDRRHFPVRRVHRRYRRFGTKLALPGERRHQLDEGSC